MSSFVGLELAWVDDTDASLNRAPPWAFYMTEEEGQSLIVDVHSVLPHDTLIS